MKFYRLLNPVHLLLSISFSILFFFAGCEKKDTPTVDKNSVNQDSLSLFHAKISSLLNEKYQASITKIVEGKFDNSGKILFACFLKKKTNAERILFIIFLDSSTIKKTGGIVYKTPLLEGDPDAIQMTQFPSDSSAVNLIYFDTGDYLMGTGGGEIFYYIIDCSNKQTYSAHFIADKERGFNLYIASGYKPWINKVFLDKAKSNYSPIKLLKKDIEF